MGWWVLLFCFAFTFLGVLIWYFAGTCLVVLGLAMMPLLIVGLFKALFRKLVWLLFCLFSSFWVFLLTLWWGLMEVWLFVYFACVFYVACLLLFVELLFLCFLGVCLGFGFVCNFCCFCVCVLGLNLMFWNWFVIYILFFEFVVRFVLRVGWFTFTFGFAFELNFVVDAWITLILVVVFFDLRRVLWFVLCVILFFLICWWVGVLLWLLCLEFLFSGVMFDLVCLFEVDVLVLTIYWCLVWSSFWFLILVCVL